MECDIKYAGKWDEEEVYYCINHHKKASINGEKLAECICPDKKKFENGLRINKENVESIVFTYPDLLNSVNSVLIINGEETSVLYIGNSMIEKRDFGGLLVSKLNNVNLEVEVCPNCGHIHSDDGQYAYKAHNPHLCAYCGKFFHVDHPNIGNELATIFNIPDVELIDRCVEITSKLNVEYDVLNGRVLVNGICCDKIKINDELYYLKDFINEKLYNEF